MPLTLSLASSKIPLNPEFKIRLRYAGTLIYFKCSVNFGQGPNHNTKSNCTLAFHEIGFNFFSIAQTSLIVEPDQNLKLSKPLKI